MNVKKAVCEEVSAEARPRLHDLLPALRRLDLLLEKGVAAAKKVYGPGAAVDNFRGLYVSHDNVEGLLARSPGAPTLWSSLADDRILPETCDETPPLDWLRQTFELSPFDADVVLVALAPELDLRYERLYAYLQDDVTRKRPTVDLALNLLCASAEEKIERRAHFAPDAPLTSNGLIHIFPDAHQTQPQLLAHYFRLDGQIVRLLLGERGLDSRLAPFCRLIKPSAARAEPGLGVKAARALPFLLESAGAEGRPVGLYFQGRRGTGKRATAEALAAAAGVPLLVADVARALALDLDPDQAVEALCREAKFQGAILYLDEFDALREDGRPSPQHRRVLTTLGRKLSGAVIMGGSQEWVSVPGGVRGVIVVPFPVPSFAERLTCWRLGLVEAAVNIEADELAALADRFRLTAAQIAEAVGIARNHALWRVAQGNGHGPLTTPVFPTLKELFSAARAQLGHELSRLARKVEPVQSWADLVLSEDSMLQLQEIVSRVAHQQKVMGEWGFGRKLSGGKGVNALFAGSSGTGKTMAAEVIANELGLDLYKIDLSGVVSKYIGETEKNLERIFDAAEHANAILFFDEADALFGKRSEVHDAHDRYANIEVAYLLQRMEQYEGVSLLATNLRQNMDEAFVRRLAFIVHFPFPDEESRRRIWTGIWPEKIALADDVDLGRLARQYKLSGGNIKNVALAAAFLAAADGGRVTMAHLSQSIRREYQKTGKVMPETEADEARADAPPKGEPAGRGGD